MTTRFFIIIGSLLGFVGVGLGAFGAHGLKQKLSAELLAAFEVGVRYQMYHALALLVVAGLLHVHQSMQLIASGWLLISGTLLFSGSLYLLAMTHVKTWGMVTPFGGLLLLLGWLMLIISGFQWQNV